MNAGHVLIGIFLFIVAIDGFDWFVHRYALDQTLNDEWPTRAVAWGMSAGTGNRDPDTRYLLIRLPSYEWGPVNYGKRFGWSQRCVSYFQGRGWQMILLPVKA